MRKFTAYIYVPKIGTFIFASFLLKYVISEFIHNIQRLVNLNINAETVGLGARCIEIAAPVITEFIANMLICPLQWQITILLGSLLKLI